jgi:hypothetical protein
MKPALTKIHLIDLAEPLICFHKLVPRCGWVIRTAEPVFMFTDEAEIAQLPIRTCLTCLHDPPRGDMKRRYVYGIMEAQAALNTREWTER